MAQPLAISDSTHPKYFTRIVEVTGSGTTRVPFSYLVDTTSRRRGTCEVVNADVDTDSRVVIQFDREWLQLVRRHVIVSVRGELQSGTSSPQIEIAGYSEIGKDRPGFATVRGTGDVVGTLSGLRLVWTDLQDALEAARDTSDRSTSTVLLGALARRDSARRALARQEVTLDSLRRVVQASPDTAARSGAERLATQVAPTIPALQDTLANATAAVAQLRGAAGYRETPNWEYVLRARRQILLRRTQLAIPLGVLAGPGGQFVRATLAQQGNLDPEPIRQLAEEAAGLARSVADSRPSPAAGPVRDSVAATIRDQVETFQGLMRTLVALVPANATAGVVTQELRDAEVLLSEVGARAGDVIVLHISDSVPDVPGRRQLDIRLRVRQLGIVRRVSDAVLLLRRDGISSSYVDPRVTAARTQFAATGRADPVDDVPLPANYLPAAGGSLLWTYYHRAGAEWNHKILNWLTPGVGINVSFATFPSKTIAFSRPDSANAPPREAVSLSPDRLQVAAGPVVTLFDNALQFTYGWNLNVPNARRYFGVGFSFVNIARRLGVTLRGTDEGT